MNPAVDDGEPGLPHHGTAAAARRCCCRAGSCAPAMDQEDQGHDEGRYLVKAASPSARPPSMAIGAMASFPPTQDTRGAVP